MSDDTAGQPMPAAVIVAHSEPRQLKRLIDALTPWPVFLHIDARTGPETYGAMTSGLPSNVELLPRLPAGWARYEVFAAEREGYRAALRSTDARHIIALTGSDYPLASQQRICEVLAAHHGKSFAKVQPLPIEGWGIGRGYDRFWFPQRPWRRHRLLAPIPRRIPRELLPGGGSQMKILSRRHAALVVDVLDERPDLLRFFRHCWIPDEVVIPTLLLSDRFGAHWPAEAAGFHPWYIDWGKQPTKSPRWLTTEHLTELAEAAARPDSPALFARKFSDTSDRLVGAIDAQLRGQPLIR